MKNLTLTILLIASFTPLFAQKLSDIEAIANASAKTTKAFPTDYKISLPRLDLKHWDNDFDFYIKYLTKKLGATQMSLNFKIDSVNMMTCTNSIIPHAQLDTATIIKKPTDIEGVWRMVSYRRLRFVDSVYRPDEFYRTDTVLGDNSTADVITIIKDNRIKVYFKDAGRSRFKKKLSAKYDLEADRYIMLYKLSKAAAEVMQIGIDENGYLILNSPSVMEHIKPEVYSTYYAIIEQTILVRVDDNGIFK